LSTALRGAPRAIVQQVLRVIDGDDVDISERDDEELMLVQDLICTLKEDIRCCKHSYYKMKSDWIAARKSGVAFNGELSPEQICDHIENEPNHEDLLKNAVNMFLRKDRKFEAAKMLARPESKGTKVFETNRNDKQLAYLVSLYQDMKPPPDIFGPVEECALVVPAAPENLLIIDRCGPEMDRFEREVFSENRPLTVGVWWFWRCFNPKIDFWPRASFIVFVYDTTFALIDFQNLEDKGIGEERRGKGIVRRVLEADHILKVVHDLDNYALKVLQRAVLTHEELSTDTPEWPKLSPVLDMAHVMAYSRGTHPESPHVSKLGGLCYELLRLELCLGEALSNFERRPLRKTQQHYAMAMAWCPLMILRCLLAFGIVPVDVVRRMPVRVGLRGTPLKWDDTMKRVTFWSEAFAESSGASDLLKGPPSMNVWESQTQEAEDWRKRIPRPDPNLRVDQTMYDHFNKCNAQPELLFLPEELGEHAKRALGAAAEQAGVSRDLNALYQAFVDHQERDRW